MRIVKAYILGYTDYFYLRYPISAQGKPTCCRRLIVSSDLKRFNTEFEARAWAIAKRLKIAGDGPW